MAAQPGSVETRIANILKAIAVFAAEFGPNWIHSDHGTQTLNIATTAIGTAAAVEGEIGAEKAQAK